MLRRATTICGGIAIVLSALPLAARVPGADMRQAVPSAAAAQAPAPLYEPRWTTPLEAASPQSLALAVDRILLAGQDGTLEARAIDTGQRLWSQSDALGRGLAVGGGRIAGIAAGALRVLDLNDGRLLWSADLAGETSGPTIAGEWLFVTSGPQVRAFRLAGGAPVWTQPLQADASLRPLTAGSLVVVASGQKLAAFSRETGEPAWRVELDSPVAAMTSATDRIVLGTADGYPCAIDLQDGSSDWCFRTTPVPAAGRPLIAGHLAYFALLDNTLRAFDLGGGTMARLVRLPSRPVSGPLHAGEHLAIPLAPGTFAIVTEAAPQQSPAVIPTPAPANQKMEAAAATEDGAWLVSLSVEVGGGRRLLAGYSRPVAAPALSPPK